MPVDQPTSSFPTVPELVRILEDARGPCPAAQVRHILLHWVTTTSILTICSPHGFFVSLQRREAVEYVLRLAKSSDRRHKALAAKNLPTYYERAPDRREEVHEAIYDLCEDAEPEVRAVALKTPGC